MSTSRTLGTIAKYPWHVAHDYELCKLDAQFDVLLSTARTWNTKNRPVPANVRFVNDVSESDADVMILHVDQWTWQELDKRRLFEAQKAAFKGKKVVINHGCNLVDGCTSAQMRDLIGELPVICNSSTALAAWDLPNARYIHHGMTAAEWPQTSYGNLNVVLTQPFHGAHQDYRNNAAGVAFEERFERKISWVGRDHQFKSFEQYTAFLARSSIYFSPSYASPNPRARTEAMLCGLVVVTTDMHGESEYIENGVNGFCSNDMEELYDRLLWLLDNPAQVRAIGKRGRQTAQERFSIERFSREWGEVLEDVRAGHPIGGRMKDAEVHDEHHSAVVSSMRPRSVLRTGSASQRSRVANS